MPNEVSKVYAVITFTTSVEVDAYPGLMRFSGFAASTSLVERPPTYPVLPYVPEVPIEQRLEWQTDILQTWNGTEQRIAVYGAPRQIWTYDVLLTTEAELRDVRARLHDGLDEPFATPLWGEPMITIAASSSGGSTLVVGLGNDDIQADDQVLVVADDGTYELHQVVTVVYATGSLVLEGTLAHDWPIGTRVYPTLHGTLAEGAQIRRALVHAGRWSIQTTTLTRRALGGRGGTVPTFNGRPLWDQPPVFRGEAIDAYQHDSETLDYGGLRARYVSRDAPEVGGSRTYLIRDADTRQTVKAFLDTVKGQQGAFYWPTYRPDLQITSQPTQGSDEVTVSDDADYLAMWTRSTAVRSVMVRTADGSSQPRLVTGVVDHGNGTQTLTLSAALTDTADGSTITQLELMPVARLASDVVQIEHYHTYSRVTLAIQTEETP